MKKEIIDAINELKGNANNVYGHYVLSHDIIAICGDGYMTTKSKHGLHEPICTIAEFKKCTEEMSLHNTTEIDFALYTKHKEPLAPVKPPLGLMPRNIFLAQRAKDIREAIQRRNEAGLVAPTEWLEELDELESIELENARTKQRKELVAACNDYGENMDEPLALHLQKQGLLAEIVLPLE